MDAEWTATQLWRETCAIPRALAATLADLPSQATALASLLSAPGVRRIVATGNGAAYYAALALWLASLESQTGPEVVAVPAGLVARGRFRWRDGDRLLAFSSSGEMRDVIEALDAGAPEPFAAITATPTSTIAARAGAVARTAVLSQDAVTHTQAFCGNVVAALSVWATITSDEALADALASLPNSVAEACATAEAWANGARLGEPRAAIVFGSGAAWAAALEGALLLKEVAGIPTEGVETREGATSAMYALTRRDLAVSLSGDDDPLGREAEVACAGREATVLRVPGAAHAEQRLAAVTTFPALVALAVRLGTLRGLDVDRPIWTDAYYAVAREAGSK
jgi:fructoselysine-6-P-deglycase FrlB-like protein